MQVGESLPFRFSAKYVKRFKGWMEKSVWEAIQTRVYLESVWLKFLVARLHALEVSHTEFQQNVWDNLWDTRKVQLWPYVY
jgi:hypothetical protein